MGRGYGSVGVLFATTVSLIILCGCSSSTTLYRNEKGKVYKIETTGKCRTEIKKGDETIIQDSKSEPFINIKPEIVGGKLGG